MCCTEVGLRNTEERKSGKTGNEKERSDGEKGVRKGSESKEGAEGRKTSPPLRSQNRLLAGAFAVTVRQHRRNAPTYEKYIQKPLSTEISPPPNKEVTEDPAGA